MLTWWRRQLAEHPIVFNEKQRQHLIVACADGLLAKFVSVGAMSVEPGVGTDLPRRWTIRLSAEQDIEGKALGVQVILRKPVIGDVGRSAEPLSSLWPVADQ
jgi:hypothetical protein